jgi:hypothetical protein
MRLEKTATADHDRSTPMKQIQIADRRSSDSIGG